MCKPVGGGGGGGTLKVKKKVKEKEGKALGFPFSLFLSFVRHGAECLLVF